MIDMGTTTRRTLFPTCARCSARIIWLRDPSSRYVAVDVHPVPGGTHRADFEMGTVAPITPGTVDPSITDEMARPTFYVLHRGTCRNITYRRSVPRPREAVCGRHLWRPPSLVTCTAPAGHEGDCP